jgi:hypothetical protein
LAEKPREVIKEVPVEKIVEKVIEIIKEVASLPSKLHAAIRLDALFHALWTLSLPKLASLDMTG